MPTVILEEATYTDMKTHLEQLDVWRVRNPLRAWRIKHNLTQRTIAQTCRVSLSSVRMWENGTMRPGVASMAALARVMDAPLLGEMWDAWLNTAPRV